MLIYMHVYTVHCHWFTDTSFAAWFASKDRPLKVIFESFNPESISFIHCNLVPVWESTCMIAKLWIQ